MCGGCNVLAESAGVSLIVARYWWVARQGRAVARAAERVTAGAVSVDELALPFVDPIDEVTRLVRT